MYLVGVAAWVVSRIPIRNYLVMVYATFGYFIGWTIIGGFFLFEGAASLFVVGGQLTPELLSQMRSNPHILFAAGPLRFSLEGAIFGFERGFKMAVPLSFVLVVLWTTGPTKILRGLMKLGMPYILAFTASSAIRFIPLLAEEGVNITDAQKVRGCGNQGLIDQFKMTYRMITPLFINSLRRSRELAASVETRGFGARSNIKRTFLVDPQLTREDYAVLVTCAIIIAASLYARFVLLIGLTSMFDLWYILRIMGY